MDINRRLLAVIGERIPAIFDALPGDDWRHAFRDDAVALNPQPLPPAPPPLEMGAAIGVEFIRMAWFAERFGLDRRAALKELDELCPLKPPPKLKWPPTWPRSGALAQAPAAWNDPSFPRPPYWINLHLGFAARVAVAAQEFEGTALGETFNAAVQRSADAVQTLQT